DAATAVAKYITLVRKDSKDTAFALHQAVHSAVHARLIHTLRDYHDPKAREASYPRAERRVRAALSLQNIGKRPDLDPAVVAPKIIAKLRARSERSSRCPANPHRASSYAKPHRAPDRRRSVARARS